MLWKKKQYWQFKKYHRKKNVRARGLLNFSCQLFSENLVFRLFETFCWLFGIWYFMFKVTWGRTFVSKVVFGSDSAFVSLTPSGKMVIEKVHGLQATGMSLNDRFTLLAAAAPDHVAARPRRRPSVNSYFNQNLNFKKQNLVDHIARRLEFEAKRVNIN